MVYGGDTNYNLASNNLIYANCQVVYDYHTWIMSLVDCFV